MAYSSPYNVLYSRVSEFNELASPHARVSTAFSFFNVYILISAAVKFRIDDVPTDCEDLSIITV